jgi:hypothetical protein
LAVIAIMMTLLWPPASHSAEAGAAACTISKDSYHGPGCCSGCHPLQHQTWSVTNHAAARADPRFQVKLQEQGEPGDCYSCHTTGYDAVSGHYALAGVTCEVCHSAYPAMSVTAAQSTCDSCHTERFDEWQIGDHGQVSENCFDCHPPHS